MNGDRHPTLRVLIAHPDEATRSSIDAILRTIERGPVSIDHAVSTGDGMERARRLEPNILFLDLSEDASLAIEVARSLRGLVPSIIGLYNPLLHRDDQSELFRHASRAGISDFVPLPASEAELEEALEAIRPDRERTESAREGNLVSFFSHQGGPGTTTLAVNVAVVLAASDLVPGEVALCDANLQLGDAAAHLGLAPTQDLVDLVRDLDELGAVATALTTHPESGLSVLASPRSPVDAELVTPEQLGRALLALERRFEVTVVDAPSHLDLLTLSSLDLSDSIYLVTEAIAPKIVGTRRLIQLFEEEGYGSRLRLVVNRFRGSEANLSEAVIEQQLGREIDHLVAYEEAVVLGTNRGQPLILDQQTGPFADAIERLASEIAQGAPTPEYAEA